MDAFVGVSMGLLLAFLISQTVTAAEIQRDLPLGPSREQNQKIQEWNASESKQGILKASPFRVPVIRPVAETERAQYLIMSPAGNFSSLNAKLEMARQLPADMELVLYTSGPGPSTESAVQPFRQILPPNRLHVITLPQSERGFWARDGLPVPVWNQQNRLALVGARYYHEFEPDAQVAALFPSELAQHSYYFEGGNFAPSPSGDCVIVNNNRVRQIPDQIFTSYYGCRTILRLPHERGIGHADETFKFIDDRRVLSDSPTHRTLLEQAGYQVTMVPRPRAQIETHVNALFVNGTAFVPVFGRPSDAAALAVFRNLGFNAVGIDSSILSNNGRGSLHCITMTYPPVALQQLLRLLTTPRVVPMRDISN